MNDIHNKPKTKFDIYRESFGKLGEQLVREQLFEKGFGVIKPVNERYGNLRSKIFDFLVYAPDANFQTYLMEIKTVASAFNFQRKFHDFPTYSLRESVFSAYEDFLKNEKMPLILTFCDFKAKKIYAQTFSKLLETEVYENVEFPLRDDLVFKSPTIFFNRAQFEVFGDIPESYCKQAIKLREDYLEPNEDES